MALTDEVVVKLTYAEAERLYASAALYETRVHRIVGVAETDLLAHSALTKLAAALADVTVIESGPGDDATLYDGDDEDHDY